MPEMPNIALRAYHLCDAAGRRGRSDECFFQAERIAKLLDPDARGRPRVSDFRKVCRHRL